MQTDAPVAQRTEEEMGATLGGEAVHPSDTEVYYGDALSRSPSDSMFRCGFLNVNGLPRNKNKEKNTTLLRKLYNYNFHIIGLTEPNLHWPSLQSSHNWDARVQNVWETSHSSLAYNTTDHASGEWQPGGCIQLSIDRAAHRIISSGRDSSGLGRWAWTRYQGRHDVTLRVVTAYRPCVHAQAGERTVHRQHERFLNQTGDARCPRTAMSEDLCNAIARWQESGDQIILMLDANEDVHSGAISLQLHQLGLREAISHQHQERGTAPTHNRGSHPIDGIFISPTLEISSGGYLPFSEFPSDHRLIWIEVPFSTAFGYEMPPLSSPAARRLKLQDPACVQKFIAAYETFIRSHSLHLQAYEIQESIVNGVLTPGHRNKYLAL